MCAQNTMLFYTKRIHKKCIIAQINKCCKTVKLVAAVFFIVISC